MEWVETTGKTIAEAKDVALDRLGVHEDDAEFEVVAEVKTGLFGRVKEDARVRARVRPSVPRAKEERRGRQRDRGGNRKGGRDKQGSGKQGSGKQGSGKQGSRKQGSSRQESRQQSSDQQSSDQQGSGQQGSGKQGSGQQKAAGDGSGNRDGDNRRNKEKHVRDDEPTMTLVEQADLAEEFMAGLTELFDVDATFERTEVDEEEIRITVHGDDLGRMIGRRGSTAGAIDELVRTVLQRQAGSGRNGRVRVDVGGVRARRAEALARFCRDRAAEVRASGTRLALEPMSSADRKVIHDTIADEDGVETESEGEDPNRRVVLVPAGDAD